MNIMICSSILVWKWAMIGVVLWLLEIPSSPRNTMARLRLLPSRVRKI